jgi:hypothetical protein
VQVKVSGKIFSATARIVTEPELRNAVQDLSRKKYGWGDGTVVELSRTENGEQRTKN